MYKVARQQHIRRMLQVKYQLAADRTNLPPNGYIGYEQKESNQTTYDRND
jgi:hypothetical protein